jgi:hypothetical protein
LVTGNAFFLRNKSNDLTCYASPAGPLLRFDGNEGTVCGGCGMTKSPSAAFFRLRQVASLRSQ